MLTFGTFNQSLMPALSDLWNRVRGDRFPMSQRLMEQNCLGDPFFRPQGGLVALQDERVVGWAHTKVIHDPPEELAALTGLGSIGAFCVAPDCGEEVRDALYERAEAYLLSAGARRISLVAFPYHFMPGIPSEEDDLIEFFAARGYTGWGEAVDLMRDITDFEPHPKAVAAMELESNAGVAIHPCGDGEVEGLLSFLSREFPSGWLYTTRLHFTQGGASEDFVIAVEHGEVIGFCHTHREESPMLSGSTYWFPLLRPPWGGLGPIGVAASVRGRGLGLALLCEGVMHLRRRGIREMAIDWTGLVDFYGMIGFQVWRRYKQAEKPV